MHYLTITYLSIYLSIYLYVSISFFPEQLRTTLYGLMLHVIQVIQVEFSRKLVCLS